MPYDPNHYYGVYDSHWYWASHAVCQRFDCIDAGMPSGSAWFSSSADIDMTATYQEL
jgi:hypothetical protein